MRVRRLLPIVGLLVSTTSALGAPKPKPPPKVEVPTDIDTAEQLFTKLDYDKANEVAERLVKGRGQSHDQLVRAYKILAVTNAILDKEEASRDAFLQLLVFDPDYTVDQALGPKVGQPYLEARAQFKSLPTKPGLDVVANVRQEGGQLRVTARDPTHIAKKLTVGYRWTSSGEYTVAQLPVADASVEVTAAAAGRTRLDFYAQALDERDNAVLEAGNPLVPKSAFADTGPKLPPGGGGKATTEKGGGILKSPVFWVVTGALVLGGGTALFFAVRPEDPPSAASLSPVIRCGSEICK